MKKIRTAVVGVGHFGRFHAEKYAGLAAAELVAVVSQSSSPTPGKAMSRQSRNASGSSVLSGCSVDEVGEGWALVARPRTQA